MEAVKEMAEQVLTKGRLAVRLANLAVQAGYETDQGTGLLIERLAQAILHAEDVVGRDGDEVPGDHDEVWLLLIDKADYTIQTLWRHPTIHMEVAYVHDPVPVEREREPGQRERHPLNREPVRLYVPRVG
jgi:hypothetical protein